MDKNIAINISSVTKTFNLPHDRNSTIKGALVNFYKKKRSIEKQVALNDVSFQIKKGEFFGIVGRNGSGKSTLLKILAGIYEPTSGSISINGKLIPFIELGVGFSPELTGRENVFLNGALLGFSRNEMLRIYSDIVEFAELEKFMDQKLKNYSSGMQVRLAFSIAVQTKADILLIDEVLAVGDAAFQRKCFDHFMELKKQNATVVLVTHDMAAIRQYCDRAIMIEGAKVIKAGKPEEIAKEYLELFIKEAETKPQKSSKKVVDRWGNGKLMAYDVKTEIDRDSIKIMVKYKSDTSLNSPVLGFTIYNPAGLNVIEGNTQRSQIPTPKLSANQSVSVEWTIPNILSNGNYSVSVACCDESTTEFYDWLNSAASININKETHTTGLTDPIITTSKPIKEDLNDK